MRPPRDRITIGIGAAALLLAVFGSLAERPDALRIAAAVPLMLVLPGWAIQRALLRDRPRDPLYVATYALGMSLVVAVLGSTALAYVQGLSAETLAALLAGVTVVACAFALGRSASGASSSEHPSPRSARLRSVGAMGLMMAALALLAGALALARTPLPVPEDRGYTELSFGAVSADATSVDVRVQSNEARERSFVLRTSPPDGPPTDRRLVLAPGEVVTEVVSVPPSASGPLRAELLSGSTSGSEVYRHIRVDLPLSDPAPPVPAGATRRDGRST